MCAGMQVKETHDLGVGPTLQSTSGEHEIPNASEDDSMVRMCIPKNDVLCCACVVPTDLAREFTHDLWLKQLHPEAAQGPCP